MNIRIVYIGQSQDRCKNVLKRIYTDILPTLLLLMVLAFAMACVARFAESSHFETISSNGQSIEVFSR